MPFQVEMKRERNERERIEKKLGKIYGTAVNNSTR